MCVQRIAAFSDGDAGGNPAGVVIADVLPPDSEMQRVAAEVGFSETAFAIPLDDGWRVRYFSPNPKFRSAGTPQSPSVPRSRFGSGTAYSRSR